MTNVLFLNDSMGGGGAERAMAELVNGLADLGNFELSLYSLEQHFDYEIRPSVATGAFRTRYRLGSVGKFLSLFHDARKLKKLTTQLNTDVVVSFQNRANFANVASQRMGAAHKSIISERVYTPHYYAAGLRSVIANYLIRKLYPRADRVTCNASEIRDCLIAQYGVQSDRIHVINNGYDRARIIAASKEPIDQSDRALFDTINGPIVVNVGRLSEQKGQAYLIEAFSRLPAELNAHLVILGEGEDRHPLERLIQQRSLTNRVSLLGRRDNPFPYIKRSNVFAFPSMYEGFPNALAEAVVLKKPIVSFDFKSGVRDVLGDYPCARIVPLKAIDEFRDAIVDLTKSDLGTVHYDDERLEIKHLVLKYARLIDACVDSRVTDSI